MKSSIWESEWLLRVVEYAGYAIATGIMAVIVLFFLVLFRTLVYRMVGVG
jgi:Mg2+/Co2+ transporter CorB